MAPRRPVQRPDPERSGRADDPVTREIHRFQSELEAENDELRSQHDRLEADRFEYHQMFEESPIAMGLIDDSGWVHRMNGAARALLALRHEGIRNGPLVAWIDRDHHERFFGHLKRVRATGARDEVELEIRCAGRSRRVRMVTDASGKSHLLVALVDITEIREAEKARLRTESRYRRLFSASRDALILFDAASSRILELNPAAHRLLAEPDAVGRCLTDFVPQEQLGAWRGLVGSALDARTPGGVAELTFEGGREPLMVEVRLSLVDRDPPTLLANLRDIRDRRKLIEERSALESRLSQIEKMEALGTLAGGIAHDMNNMLTAVRMAASSLVEELEPDTASREDAEAILSACTRFSRLMENLLGFARNRPGSRRSAPISEVVQEMTSLVENRLRKSQVRLETHYEQLDLAVDADPARLTQCLMNLVLNALDELPAAPTSRILIRARTVRRAEVLVPEDVEGQEFVRITVEDNGPGMPPKVRDRAFDPFFTTKPEGKGTGLGLAVVYRNIRQSGGWVSLDSDVGLGTRLHLLLPPGRPNPPAGPEPGASGETARPLRVLVVEDETLVAKSVGRFLRRCGFVVDHAANGRLGVAAFEAEAPDVVLLDVVMPEMDGPTCAQHIRRRRPDVPILFYSGHLRDHGLPDLHLDEKTGYLEKPFEFEVLHRQLSALLKRSAPAPEGARIPHP